MVLLYPIPFEPERERREILVLTTPESEKTSFSFVSILPERPRISPVALAR